MAGICAAFDAQDDQRAGKLYFATSDWNMLLTQLTSAESGRYFVEQRTNSPPPVTEQSVAEQPGRRASADKTAKIALIVELTTRDAKDTLGRELAAYSAQLALNNAFGNSRRWIGLSDRLVKAGRSFIDQLAIKIRSIDAGSAAGETYTKSVEGFVAHLESIFDDHWAKDAPWRQNKTALAPAWQSEKAQLELALKVQQAEFEGESEPIDVVGMQFSYADMWAVLGEDPPNPEVKGNSPNDQDGSSRAKQSAQKSRKGRAKGTGYQRADAPLLEKMREAIASNPALNANSAAKLVANEAEGASFEAKVDRLARAFRAGRNGE